MCFQFIRCHSPYNYSIGSVSVWLDLTGIWHRIKGLLLTLCFFFPLNMKSKYYSSSQHVVILHNESNVTVPGLYLQLVTWCLASDSLVCGSKRDVLWKLETPVLNQRISSQIKQPDAQSHDLCGRGPKEQRQMVKYGDKTCKNEILSTILCMNLPIVFLLLLFFFSS